MNYENLKKTMDEGRIEEDSIDVDVAREGTMSAVVTEKDFEEQRTALPSDEMGSEQIALAAENFESNQHLSQKEKEKAQRQQSSIKEQLNQEDIDAVQFLAAEFSKEISTTKIPGQKIQLENSEDNVVEVTTLQEGSNVGETSKQINTAGISSSEAENENTLTTLESKPLQARKRKLKADEREFKCSFCAKSFSMKIALEKHLVVHGAKLPWQCTDCSEGFMKSSDYKEHCNKIHNNFRPFPCDVCGKRLSNLGILKNHQGIHSGERPFTCKYPNCDKSFLTRTNLDDHERKHVNAREFECSTCHKRFNLKGDLRQHEKVHKEEKPFRCEFCDMSFPRGPSLWRHRRTHTGEKPYECDVCGKRFSRMENCQEHRRIHTGERPLICAVCGKSFRDSGNFSNHKKIHLEGYVPRKKRALGSKRTKEQESNENELKTTDKKLVLLQKEEMSSGNTVENASTSDISQEVAFIVAPMQAEQGQDGMNISASVADSSYVQVGNFLLTLEMEAAFKQMMQQHAGNNEFVTLTMADGKSLELISDPSQAEALMQVAAQSQSMTDVQLQDVQDIIKQEAARMEADNSGVETTDVGNVPDLNESETVSNIANEADIQINNQIVNSTISGN